MSPNFGTVSDLRAGDPAAIAIAVFDQGCTNQSEATAKAVAEASRSCTAWIMQPASSELNERPKLITMQTMTDDPRHVAPARRVGPTLLLSARSREMSTP